MTPYDLAYLAALLGPAAAFGLYGGWLTGVVAGFALAVAVNRCYVVFNETRGRSVDSVAGLTLITLPVSESLAGFAALAYL